MTQDAKFQDADERPLSLRAIDSNDMQVISSLVQDAVVSGDDITCMAKQRRFAILLKRYRWERKNNTPQRVQSLLVFDDVFGVSDNGLDPRETLVLSILSLSHNIDDDGRAYIIIHLAGDGEIKLQVETINLALRDSSQAYDAVSGQRPEHKLK